MNVAHPQVAEAPSRRVGESTGVATHDTPPARAGRFAVVRTGGSILAAALIVGSILHLLSTAVADTDLWGHVRFGLDKLQSRSLRLEDTYSYLTSGRTWFNHESLAEAVFGVAYTLAGGAGLILLKLGVVLVVIGAVYLRLIADGLSPLRGALVLVPVGVQFWMAFSVVRPQMFTVLFFTGLILILSASERGRGRMLWALPILFGVWINTHGGVLAGLAVFGVWAVVRSVTHPKSAATITAVALASLGATMITPHGPELLAFLVRTTTVPRPEIVEWHPVPLMSLRGYAYAVLAAICTLGWLRSSRPRSPASFAVFLCALLLPLAAQRHLYLFAVAAPLVSAEHIADAWNRWRQGRRLSGPFVGVVLAGAVAFSLAMRPDLGCVRVDVEAKNPYPARAVALLEASGVEANVAVPCFCWGEYVIWHAGPAIKVSVDARRETVYSDEVWRQNLDMHRGEGDWDALLRLPETDLVLVQQGSATNNLMLLHQGWELAYADPTSAIYGRRGSPLVAALRETPVPDVPHDGAGMCFG